MPSWLRNRNLRARGAEPLATRFRGSRRRHSYLQTRFFDGFFPISEKGLEVIALLKRLGQHLGVPGHSGDLDIVRRPKDAFV